MQDYGLYVNLNITKKKKKKEESLISKHLQLPSTKNTILKMLW